MQPVAWIAPDANHPPRRGGTLRLWGLLAAASRSARIVLVGATADEPAAARARARCLELGVEPRIVARGPALSRWRAPCSARIERWNATPALEAEARRALAGHSGLVHVDEPGVLRLVPRGARVHTLAHPKLELDYARAFAARPSERRDVRRVEALERRSIPSGALQLLSSELDKERLCARHPGARARVVENGVDLAALGAPPSFLERDVGRLLWLGSLDYPPNVQGLVAFLRLSWPALRAARPALVLEVVGSGPSHLLGDLRIDGVRFLGEVADPRPALARAGALVVPLATGGGTRLKLLEAAALGVPIVATRVAAEGLPFEDGREARIVERIEDLGQAALEVLDQRDAARARCLAARAIVERRYDWSRPGAALIEAWDEAWRSARA
jgi:glycosyltransferase involved in cell wall biosynthesis